MHRILLLNASYEPLAVINQRRALSLVVRGRVEAACDSALEMHSVSRTLRIPTVIRLRRYVHVPDRRAHWSRRGVLARDRYTCVYCGIRPGRKQGARFLTRDAFTVDHIIPISRGGKNTWGNTVCACKTCNQRKADRTPSGANMKLRWEPKTPRVNYLVLSGEIPAAWKIHLQV
jgi:5-methylcytosine-specific restriction endonuclease McrA